MVESERGERKRERVSQRAVIRKQNGFYLESGKWNVFIF